MGYIRSFIGLAGSPGKKPREPGFDLAAELCHKAARDFGSDIFSRPVTVKDPFNRYDFRQVLGAPGLHEVNVGRGSIQAIFLGQNWSYGAATKRPQGFDFTPQ